MKISWRRGTEQLSYNKPSCFFSLGVRGSGKSSCLEHIAENHLEKHHTIIDLFGSRDGENLCWLRSPHAKDKRILLLKDSVVDVKSSFTVKSADALTLSDIENFDIIISASPLYSSIHSEFFHAGGITDLLYKRLHWKQLAFVIVREASNLYYSRLKISSDQIQAKSEMIYLLREGRHLGLALGIDSLRYHSLDIDVRTLADYLILKSQGTMGLPRDLRWLYSYVDAKLLRNMEPQQFIMLTSKGAIGFGTFPYPKWHKEEKEDIVKELGLEITYGEPLQEAILKGTYKTVGDTEHAEIIRLYMEEQLSMMDIGAKLHRSSRTPKVHVDAHNQAVRRSGFCGACKRAESPYYSKEAVKQALGNL